MIRRGVQALDDADLVSMTVSRGVERGRLRRWEVGVVGLISRMLGLRNCI